VGFEPTTSCTRNKRTTKLCYGPNEVKSYPDFPLPESFKNPDKFLPTSEAVETSEIPLYLNFELQNYILTLPLFSTFAPPEPLNPFSSPTRPSLTPSLAESPPPSPAPLARPIHRPSMPSTPPRSFPQDSPPPHTTPQA